MADYEERLFKRLIDSDKWWNVMGDDEGALNELYKQISRDVEANTVSGKIALILLQHQLFHELLRDIISASTLFLQGEIWPTRFEPAYDGGKDKTTGWYITYYEDHCIDCKGKSNYITAFREANKIRNKVAHKLIGKNDAVINQSYKDFIKISGKVIDSYSVCSDDIHRMLTDLTNRVDFKELLSSN